MFIVDCPNQIICKITKSHKFRGFGVRIHVAFAGLMEYQFNGTSSENIWNQYEPMPPCHPTVRKNWLVRDSKGWLWWLARNHVTGSNSPKRSVFTKFNQNAEWLILEPPRMINSRFRFGDLPPRKWRSCCFYIVYLLIDWMSAYMRTSRLLTTTNLTDIMHIVPPNGGSHGG